MLRFVDNNLRYVIVMIFYESSFLKLGVIYYYYFFCQKFHICGFYLFVLSVRERAYKSAFPGGEVCLIFWTYFLAYLACKPSGHGSEAALCGVWFISVKPTNVRR